MTHQLEWIVFASYIISNHLFCSSQMSSTVNLSSWEYYHPGQWSRMIGAAINHILASLVHDLSWWAVTVHQWAQLRDKRRQCWNLSWLYYTDYISIVVNHVKTAALVSSAVCILYYPHSSRAASYMKTLDGVRPHKHSCLDNGDIFIHVLMQSPPVTMWFSFVLITRWLAVRIRHFMMGIKSNPISGCN